jgi:hypothetical protein
MLADRRDELVAPSRRGFNKRGILWIVPQSASDVEHVPLHGLRLDVSVGPYSIEEFVVGH